MNNDLSPALPSENRDPLPDYLHTVKNQPFIADSWDALFALFVFILGYIFTRWVFFSWRGWCVFAFSILFLFAVWFYALNKGYSINNKSAWFWTAITALTGLSFALWDGSGITIKPAFLFGSALYFVLALSNRQILGHTGNYLLIDGLNSLILIPFRNFFNQYICLFSLIHRKTNSNAFRKKLPVIIGLVISVIMLLCLIPPLLRADSGGFSNMINSIHKLLRIRSLKLDDFLIYAALSLPVSAYIFGLVSGAVHNRKTDTISVESANTAISKIRFLHPVTVYIALSAICSLYAVFILCQIPYFFSAFTGVRPDGWLSYSEYAREGFFDLCKISTVNLAIMAVGNITCIKTKGELKLLRILNSALSLISILLISTAMSKMALYINVFGLSMPRLLPCVFMVFLTAVFTSIVVLQKRKFSIVRFSLVLGSIMLCALCLANPDAFVVRYNTERYLSGTLSNYDTDILYRAEAAGVLPAIEVFIATDDEILKSHIWQYLQSQQLRFHRDSYTSQANLESGIAKDAITSRNLVG